MRDEHIPIVVAVVVVLAVVMLLHERHYQTRREQMLSAHVQALTEVVRNLDNVDISPVLDARLRALEGIIGEERTA